MSDTHAENSRLAELTSKLGLHEHLCLIYDTQEEQFAAALPFLRTGLERGEKCLYVVDENTAAAVLDALRQGGTDVDHYLRSGALTIAHKQETYLEGRFDPDWMICFLTQATALAGAARFSGIRTLGEITWLHGTNKGTDKLIEFESKLNRFVRDHDARVICQYNRTRVSPDVILGVLRTHPLVVYGGHIAKNPYYVPPEEFLKPNQPALEIDRLLNNILEWQQAQEAQRQSEERFRTLFAAVQAGVVVTGPKAEVLMCNPAALGLLGVTEDQLLGTTPYDPKWKVIYEDGSPWPPEAHPIPKVIATGQPVRNALMGVYRPVLQDLVWLLVSAQPQFAADGSVSQVICSFEDITERKRAEDDLRRQKEILQKIFDNAPIMINFTGADGRIELVNREWERTIGWTLKEIREQNLDIFAATYPDPQYRQKVLEFVAAAEGKFTDFRTTIRDKRVIDTSWARVRVSDGTTIGIGRDITERKLAEESLRHSEERLRLVIDTVPAFIHTGLPDGYLDFFNQRWLDYFGLSLEDLSGWKWTALIHPEDVAATVEKWRAALATGEPFEHEARLRRADGEYRWMVHRKVPLRDERGNIVKWYASSTDIEDRKRAEESLRESEERFRTIFENAGLGTSLVDRQGHPIKCNPAIQKMLGYTEKELRSMAFTDFTHPDDKDLDWALYSELLAGKRDRYEIEKRYIKKDGQLMWGHLTVSLVSDKNGAPGGYTVGMVEDITERKQAEEALRRSEAYLAAGQRLSHTGSWALNVGSGELFWSQETYHIFGFDPAKTSASICGTFLPRIHPEDRPRIEEGLKAAAIQKGSYGIDYRILLPDGSIKHIHDVVYPVTSETGDVVERYGVIMDVTDRKQAEEALQKSRDQLRALAARVQRIREEERTRVAREIHDELGQALTAIKIDLSSLSRELPADKKPEAESTLKVVDETIQSVRRISTELRPPILDAVGLVAAVEWAAGEFEARTGTRCQLDLPQEDIAIDPERATELFRIFQETLTNVARHADATVVSVRLAKEDGNLNLEVHDNGKGISEEQLSAASSLGILGMRERALLLGGELTISGAVGEGTTVRVRIPEALPHRRRTESDQDSYCR